MKINRGDSIRILTETGLDEAIRIAIANLKQDFKDTLNCDTDNTNDSQAVSISISTGDASLPREGYALTVMGNCLSISGADRRGTIYGIYTLSEMLGVSPWHFMADVPKKKKEFFELPEGFVLTDAPKIPYRGIFINDEEELEKWVTLHMGEETIGVKTYEKIFELLLRLKLNYIWPAMHVNSFNMKKENGDLANRMGMVVGTSHCDMLMRSNNREWVPWLQKKGYENVEYDYSIPGRNRDILNEYWAESVEQNKEFEVSYTLGMRGVHDSGFEVRSLEGLSGKELLDAKIELLETVINAQEKILNEKLPEEPLKIFVPYKEVLELYDNGLKVPEDLTLIWVNDNYGYVRRYPGEKEKQRKGGNGIYYHNSYWAPPGNSYMFINTIPLAHTKNELTKAYNEGVQKLWVTNFGTIKPLEEELSYFADLAWETGKENPKTEDVDIWLAKWLSKTFTGSYGEALARLLNDFDQLTNVRKVEHLNIDVFPVNGYGDEGGHRLHEYERIVKGCNEIYESLPEEEKDAFFQMILMKVHAAYFSNAMFYYADRSNYCHENGKLSAATEYTLRSLQFDRLRRKLLFYYNNVMSEGKWSGILTPEDFPPPRTAMYPACKPAISESAASLKVSCWGNGEGLYFTNTSPKWIEIGNAGDGEINYEITCPEWLSVESINGKVSFDKRIAVSLKEICDKTGDLSIYSPNTGETIKIRVEASVKAGDEDDLRLLREATDFSEKSEGVTIIPRLGRDHGSLVQLDRKGAYTKYTFEVNDETVSAKMIIHRFPTLNSVGKIRAIVTVDDKDEYLYEAEAVDEHIGNWKDNVQNNGDLKSDLVLKLSKGTHTLKIAAVDKYFAFSRFMLVFGNERKCNLAVNCYGEPLPEEIDTEAFAEKYYGDITLEPRREIFTTMDVVHNANTDYDDYRPGAEDVPLENWITKYKENVARIIESAKSPLKAEFDAAAVLANTEFANATDPLGKLNRCNSPADGGACLGMYMREKGLHLKAGEAPELNYVFETEESGDHTLWLKLYMWGTDESKFEVIIDGNLITGKNFLKPKYWSYSSEHAWKWYQIYRTGLDKGRHTLTVRLLDSRLRLDKIHFERSGEIWK